MKYIKGNLLDAETEALVNTVNIVGVMGKGIALQFKENFPQNYKEYIAACKSKQLMPGKLLVVKELTLEGEKIIINFPTKTEWFLKSKYEYIESGLKELINVIKEYNIKSIAIPPLGCGNGGLKWEKVKSLMENYLGNIENVEIIIYEPNEAIKELLKLEETNKQVELTPARAMLLYAMFHYEALGEHSTLFVANKLAYFLQRLGENTLNKLKFEAKHYGPYSVGVQHVLHRLNGKYLKGLEQNNVKPFEQLELDHSKFNEIEKYIKKELTPKQQKRIDKLIMLIDGFQSTLSLEILASVDFIRKENKDISKEKTIDTIHRWSDRKKELFQEKYISLAYDHLNNFSNVLEFATTK